MRFKVVSVIRDRTNNIQLFSLLTYGRDNFSDIVGKKDGKARGTGTQHRCSSICVQDNTDIKQMVAAEELRHRQKLLQLQLLNSPTMER